MVKILVGTIPTKKNKGTVEWLTIALSAHIFDMMITPQLKI